MVGLPATSVTLLQQLLKCYVCKEHLQIYKQNLVNYFIKKMPTFSRYISVSVITYVYIFLAMYILIDIVKLNQTLVYIVVYIAAYVFEYAVTLTFVFRAVHKGVKVIKFMFEKIAFALLGAFLFHVLVNMTIHYIYATIIVAVLLLPVRFVTNKYYIYR